MSKPKHSPLPWTPGDGVYYSDCVYSRYSLLDANGDPIAEVGFRSADFDFIVRACNSHHGLVSGLEWALKALVEADDVWSLRADGCDCEFCTAREALAKAKGEVT